MITRPQWNLFLVRQRRSDRHVNLISNGFLVDLFYGAILLPLYVVLVGIFVGIFVEI
jgi:hypothetical protein